MTIGLEQVNAAKPSTLHEYPLMPKSSVPEKVRVIESDVDVVIGPFCIFNSVLLSIAEVMNVSGGFVAELYKGSAKVVGGCKCWEGASSGSAPGVVGRTGGGKTCRG